MKPKSNLLMFLAIAVMFFFIVSLIINRYDCVKANENIGKEFIMNDKYYKIIGYDCKTDTYTLDNMMKVNNEAIEYILNQ